MGDPVSMAERKTPHAHGTQFLSADDTVPKEELKAEAKKPDIDSFSSPKITSKENDPAHDGKFSFTEALKNFGRGIISPITSMFGSIKGFLIGAGMMIGGAALVSAATPTILPLFIAIGIMFGVFQGGLAAYKIATAKNGDDIEKAFFEIGLAGVSLVPSVLGAKAALARLRIPTKDMSVIQLISRVFQELPRRTRISCRNLKASCMRLQDKLANIKKIRPIANEMYDEEIKILSESLGVQEDELAQIMPKRPGYILLMDKAGGTNMHLMKPRIKISPHVGSDSYSVAETMGPTIRDRVAYSVCHEVRHSYQRILPINQLTLREHLQIIESAIANLEKNDSQFTLGPILRFITKLNAILRHCSRTGRKIKALDIPKNKKMRLKGEQWAQEEINTVKAQLDALLLKHQPGWSSGSDGYTNSIFEVDARQHSMFRRLEILISDVKRGKDSENWAQRFRFLRKDLDTECPGFKEPKLPELNERLGIIKSRVDQAKQELMAKGLQQEELNKPYDAPPKQWKASMEEELEFFPELAHSRKKVLAST